VTEVEVTAETDVPNVLARVPLFEGIDHPTLDGLADLTFTKTFGPDEAIVEQGHTGNGMYVILTGRVEVIRGEGGDREQVLATLGEGEPFGELALLGDWKRTATVRSIEQTTCLGLDRWAFLAYLERHPSLALKMLQYVAQRLVDADARIGS
jgi:CRP-like cAMP-binding protein